MNGALFLVLNKYLQQGSASGKKFRLPLFFDDDVSIEQLPTALDELKEMIKI